MSIKETVKQKYGEAALRVFEGGSACCCGPKLPTGLAQTSRMSHEIYAEGETAEFLKGGIENIPLPDSAVDLVSSHLELRDQPVRRQEPRVEGGVPCPEARRAICGIRRRALWRDSCRASEQPGVVGGLPRRALRNCTNSQSSGRSSSFREWGAACFIRWIPEATRWCAGR